MSLVRGADAWSVLLVELPALGSLASSHANLSMHLSLRLDGGRRNDETDSENVREPDPPHGHLGWGAGGSLAEQ
jgi:hypothetical protein